MSEAKELQLLVLDADRNPVLVPLQGVLDSLSEEVARQVAALSKPSAPPAPAPPSLPGSRMAALEGTTPDVDMDVTGVVYRVNARARAVEVRLKTATLERGEKWSFRPVHAELDVFGNNPVTFDRDIKWTYASSPVPGAAKVHIWTAFMASTVHWCGSWAPLAL